MSPAAGTEATYFVKCAFLIEACMRAIANRLAH